VNILIDSHCYPRELFGLSFEFLMSHGLIEVKEYLTKYKVVFVGEVVTPHNHFVSLPKNFTNESESSIKFVKVILKEFKTLKKNGRLLISNKSYEVGHEISSDFYYWRKLYAYFTDYITYEFYYPQKRNIVHTTSKKHGRLNPLLTEVNRKRIGNGATYEVKDYKDNTFRNIFYTTLKELEKEFASDIESNKIKQVELFLISKNLAFRLINIEPQAVLKYTKSLSVNPVHEPIKKTITNYYLNSKIKEKNTINVFYTQEFEYVFEFLLQTVLDNDITFKNRNWINPNFKSLRPDVITHSFIGDAKYYQIVDFSHNPFEKELYAYNVANNNTQPNFVFIPSEETRHLQTLQHNDYKLEIVTLDLKAILFDHHNQKRTTLNYIENLIGQPHR
jgi:hypothetical protein